MKYDDASWHSEGDFPVELSDEAGATHIGMFVSRCLLRGMGGPLHTEEFPEALADLRKRATTPGQFILSACDGKFTDEDLDDQGNAFASVYFTSNGDEPGLYLSDYEAILGRQVPTLYHVVDSWENYEKLAATIDRRFDQWRAGELTSSEHENFNLSRHSEDKPWWKFW